MSKIVVAASFLLYALNASSYTLEEYLSDIKAQNNQYRALEQESKGAELLIREGDLVFTPQLFFNASHSFDGKKPLSEQQLQKRVENDLYSLGISQKFDFGLEAKLSYDVSKTNILGSGFNLNGTVVEEDYKNVWDATPKIELMMPLWGNSFGKADRAQQTLAVEKRRAENYQSRAQLDALLVEAEVAYWNLAALQENVRVQTLALQSSQNILNYVSDKRRKNLGEEADVLQARAMVDSYKMQLEQAKMDERAGQRKFNQFLNRPSLEPVGTLAAINYNSLEKKMTPPQRPGDRADVRALQAQIELARAASVVTTESVKPSLNIFGSYNLNGRDDGASGAISDTWSSGRESAAMGVRFQMPLNLSAVSDIKQGANLNVKAAELKHQHALYTQEEEWKDLIEKFNDAKETLKLARTIENAQKAKLENERARLRQGRTTTYQVLLFEQDFNQAQLTRVRTATQILAVESQFKMYNVSSEGN